MSFTYRVDTMLVGLEKVQEVLATNVLLLALNRGLCEPEIPESLESRILFLAQEEPHPCTQDVIRDHRHLVSSQTLYVSFGEDRHGLLRWNEM